MEESMRERLQKIIAEAGVTSRRKAEELILAGRVTVNGEAVTRLGVKADSRRDRIEVDARPLRREPHVYIALNKPRGVITAVSDPRGRPVVTDFVRAKARIYPAGRLDYESEGLVILTNDGDLARRVTQAGRLVKTYRVKVRGRPSEPELIRLRRGAMLDEGEKLAPCDIILQKSGENCWYDVRLHQGRNRQVRRMFESVGHPVMRLRRLSVGPVRLGDLPPGGWRPLTDAEIEGLRGTGGAVVGRAGVRKTGKGSRVH
jgi:23S rRNA pseudouridine2605 synthase